MIWNLYKQCGETPLECIQRFAKATPELRGQKMTYIGRLDPLAEGVLLVASGKDVKRKEEFLGLDKEYEFSCIFGFATDTYDILGKITKVEKLNKLLENEVRKVAQIYEGERMQEYPEFSSPRIASPESIPEKKKIIIHKLQFHGLDTLNSKELFGRLLMDIGRVKGEFRQDQILNLWEKALFGSNLPFLKVREGDKETDYFLGRFSAYVSSGTYIRGIVNDIGKTLGCRATTLSIRRTRVGDYKIQDSTKF